MLTAEQIACFKTFGFLLFRQPFSREEVETISRAAEDTWEKELGRSPEKEEDMHTVPFVEKHPLLMPLMEDTRIYEPVGQLLGKDFIWSGSEGNRGFQPGRTAHHWHADRQGKQELNYTRIKIMLYLDSMRKARGAFRVIPGSHRSPLHEDLEPFQRSHVEDDPTFFGMDGADVPCHAVETDPGDMLMFNQSLYHSVYGKTGQRRYIALKYAARPTQDAHLNSLQRWSPKAFHPDGALLNSDRPRIRGMVDGLVELGEKTKHLKSGG